jgi:hypothetical protein
MPFLFQEVFDLGRGYRRLFFLLHSLTQSPFPSSVWGLVSRRPAKPVIFQSSVIRFCDGRPTHLFHSLKTAVK